jgi:uncharacterized protein (TIGR00290 family)
MKVVAAWSGGKDGCFAYYKAVKQGLDVVSLISFMESEHTSGFHGLPTGLLEAQADAIGVPMHKQVTDFGTYEQNFKAVLSAFKAKGVEGLVTGDIYEVAGHEERWLERVCSEVGIKPIRPLWQLDTKEIFKDYLSAGFTATVVRTKLSLLGLDWIGRTLNQSFYDDILKLGNVDACGEGGEYHTIVTDGPIFNKRINLTKTEKTTRGEYGRLEILGFTVEPKVK